MPSLTKRAESNLLADEKGSPPLEPYCCLGYAFIYIGMITAWLFVLYRFLALLYGQPLWYGNWFWIYALVYTHINHPNKTLEKYSG